MSLFDNRLREFSDQQLREELKRRSKMPKRPKPLKHPDWSPVIDMFEKFYSACERRNTVAHIEPGRLYEVVCEIIYGEGAIQEWLGNR